jgi:hypothetical protein
MMQDLEDTLLAEDKEKDGNTEMAYAKMKQRQLNGKNMHHIAKSQDVSKEEASFCLSGGQLKYNSMVVMTCSLNQVEFLDFGSNKEAAETIIRYKYVKFSNLLTHLDLVGQFGIYAQWRL